ncbi:MAG: hypothetical protein ABJP34_03750 [Erythrobacter sp.]
MGFFKSDLYRNFAIGFVLGACVVVASAAPDWQAEFAPKAFAAENAEAGGDDSGSVLAKKAP